MSEPSTVPPFEVHSLTPDFEVFMGQVGFPGQLSYLFKSYRKLFRDSKWIINRLQSTYNVVYGRYNPLILTFDPNKPNGTSK